MFIAISKYLKSLDEVDEKRGEHLTYISNFVLAGTIILVGRQTNMEGAVILAHNINRDELENILNNDPYVTNDLAQYSIFEFNAGMFAQGIEEALQKL